MYSREHFLIGVVVSGLLLVPLSERFGTLLLAGLFVYGVLLSVFIDLDHFVLTRIRTGSWRHLTACLKNPVAAFGDQDWVFEDVDSEDLEHERILSHVFLGGVLVALSVFVSPAVAVFTAVVLYFHVLADLLRDTDVL
ncbi:hypothetical protein SAMN05421858_2081 [Haladaptatus litoreus]|uniref:LexA-binding, inner membrane-associated hydrolase n=1 Tax=Haladaptatus litoreus TaxID=553468 RepID=A0A1N6ZLI8_9EURY|nr:hypothetical protein [Haladaptatus litoreus]SIR27753.1 hypothetical protein SAMN05421858_2081 [Haladaptatus litoreus]